MKNKDFDSIDKLAQDALSNFEVEFDSMDWLQMQSKLREEKSIDQVAKDALEDYEVPYDARNWARLEQQLDKKDQFQPYMWWLKGAEVGIMALLVFTVFRFTTDQQNPEQNSTYGNTTTLIQQTISSENQNNSKEAVAPLTPSTKSTDVNSSNAASDTETEAVITKPQALLYQEELEEGDNTTTYNYSASTPAPIERTVQDDSKKDHRTTVVETNTMSKTSKATIGAAQTDNEVPNQTTSGFSGKDGTVSTATTSTLDDNNTVLSNGASTLETRTENIAADNNMEDAVDNSSNKFSVLNLSTIELSQIKGKHTDPVFELKKARLDLPYRGRTHIGGVAIIGANFASSLGGTSVGYGAGVTLDHEFTERVALKTGLLVNLKQYALRETETNPIPDGSSYTIDRNLKTDLVVIEMPVDVQYTFFHNEKWKIYAVAGVSTNFISSRTYSGTEDYSGTQTYSTPGMSLSRTINADDYEQGLFTGGQFTRNVFLSVGGGVGLERRLGEKISLYILPIYRHAVTPTGDDFLSSFGVNIGVKSVF